MIIIREVVKRGERKELFVVEKAGQSPENNAFVSQVALLNHNLISVFFSRKLRREQV